jgi:hypothetical protein
MRRAFLACVQLGLHTPKLIYSVERSLRRALGDVASSLAHRISTMDYSFPKPGTTEPAPKQFVETRVDNQGCGVAYHQ